MLGYNWMFPLITETYIREELPRCCPTTPISPGTAPRRRRPDARARAGLFDDLDRAVAEFRPDVLFLHWAGFAEPPAPELERVGLPFGVRMHGFDLHPE